MTRRPYVRAVSRTGWWLTQPRYLRYMIREMSSAFIGGYAIILVVGLYRLSQGAAEYDAFREALFGPVGVAITIVTLSFAVYHTFTWFQVTPKAMPLVFAGRRVPGFVIVAAHWLAFALVSGALWVLLGSR